MQVYIAIKGIDLSQAIRPLVQSFFNNEKAEYEYFELEAEDRKSNEIPIHVQISGGLQHHEQKDALIRSLLPQPKGEGLSVSLLCLRNFAAAALYKDAVLIGFKTTGQILNISSEGSNADHQTVYGVNTECSSIHTEEKTVRQQCISVKTKEEQTVGLIDNEKNSRVYRDRVCAILYDLLKDFTGRSLPWGILVGIRPTKRIYEALEDGRTEDEIRNEFESLLYVSSERTEVSIDIAKREKRILSGFDYQNGYSIYIGIPFCPTTCLYCSFTSYPVAKFGSYMDAYLEALTKEIAYAATAIKDKRLNTIYVGGGTPTALDEKNLEKLMQAIHRYLPTGELLEFSVEAGRPDSINEKKLEILKKYGVTRISINPQSLVQRTLDTIGRRHDVESVYRAFRLARAAGHDNINMDLIAGLTGETPADMAVTLKGVSELAPESLTVHTLAVKRAARLKLESEKYAGHEATGVREMLDMTVSYAAEHGLKPYYLYRQKNMTENLENVGYALEGRECLYNILIMEERQTILALGAGASTKYVYNPERLDRIENVKSLTDYIERVDEMIERKRSFLSKIDS